MIAETPGAMRAEKLAERWSRESSALWAADRSMQNAIARRLVWTAHELIRNATANPSLENLDAAHAALDALTDAR
jgi:hypothetical protein